MSCCVFGVVGFDMDVNVFLYVKSFVSPPLIFVVVGVK